MAVEKLIPGEWYEDAYGTRCLAYAFRLAIRQSGILCSFSDDDLRGFTHLPDCTGWDWQPPKPKLQLAAGKWYRNRRGEKRQIVFDYGSNRKFRWLANNGTLYRFNGSCGDAPSEYDLIEETTPPEPKYRPFKNAEEFKPHRDRWWRYKINPVDVCRPPEMYGDSGYGAQSWKAAFENRVFDDGSPFGVKIED